MVILTGENYEGSDLLNKKNKTHRKSLQTALFPGGLRGSRAYDSCVSRYACLPVWMRRCPPPPSALRKIGQPNCSVLSQPPENGYTIPHTVRYHAAFTFVLRFVFPSEKENRPERRHSEKRTNSRRTRVPLVRARKPVYLEERTVEPYYADWLSLLPPIIAISLALITKEVISSLLIGILSGTLIYTIGSGSGSPIVGTVEATFTIMTAKVDFDILIFCTLLGALVYTISMAGGTRAYGN